MRSGQESRGGILKTRLITISPHKVKTRELELIAGVLSRGGVIVYPTDTYYGLGANCYLGRALRRIYEIKKRQAFRGLPVLVAAVDDVPKIAAEIPHLFDSLTAEFWPGPLTLVLKAAAALPVELAGPQKTIGVRLPDIPWLRSLIRLSGFPLVATSANISGRGEIASAEKVIEVFELSVDLIVDGGTTTGVLPSTVLDLTSGAAFLVREGAVPKSRLLKYLT
jgi:L-threonylcarbamoyladenylate synthase